MRLQRLPGLKLTKYDNPMELNSLLYDLAKKKQFTVAGNHKQEIYLPYSRL